MHKIYYKNATYHCGHGESMLDAFLRQGVNVPFSCRSGSCHVCIARCSDGQIPEASQRGVSDKLRDLDCFLPCKCIPESDMHVEEVNHADLFVDALVSEKELLAPDICRLRIETAVTIDYRPGQFVNLRRRNSQLVRSYSLASVPDEDYFLELHIRRRHNGAMSNWIFDQLQVGDELELQGPIGNFTYVDADLEPSQPILMLATGTGLAPVLGVLRSAVAAGHSGPISLYHGSRDAGGLYRHEWLLDFARQHPNLEYHPCVSAGEPSPSILSGRASQLAFTDHPVLDKWAVFVAGSPDAVNASTTSARTLGAEKIFSDAFEMKDLREPNTAPDNKPQRRLSDAIAKTGETGYPPPDPELWAALDADSLLQRILKEFYSRVYKDPRLSPFFRNVTQTRLREKQYLFLRQILTGEKVYFGDRPRNAHHWMVISDELFDHREQLMVDVIREHGLAEHLVERWQKVEASFRQDIVKDKPHGKIIDGIEMPFEGFEELVLDAGTLCDSCNGVIDPGTRIRYHVRLGTTYCPNCMNDESVLKSVSMTG